MKINCKIGLWPVKFNNKHRKNSKELSVLFLVLFYTNLAHFALLGNKYNRKQEITTNNNTNLEKNINRHKNNMPSLRRKFCWSKKIKKLRYRISSNKRRASNKRRPLINVTPLGIHIEISVSL